MSALPLASDHLNDFFMEIYVKNFLVSPFPIFNPDFIISTDFVCIADSSTATDDVTN